MVNRPLSIIPKLHQSLWVFFPDGKLYAIIVKVKVLVPQSCLTLCDPWTVAHQVLLSMKFSRQEYWTGVPLNHGGKHILIEAFLEEGFL